MSEILAFFKAFTPASYGIYALLAVVLVALIKAWPLLTAQAIKAREQMRSEKRAELDDLRRRIGELEKGVTAATKAAHEAELKLVYAVSAIQLLAAKVRRDAPDDPALQQAMELLSAATGGGLPGWAGKLAGGLTSIKGTEE